MQACDALAHAHKKGVIHRDLKSSNIMLVDDENATDIVKVLDFGIAKLMPSSGKLPQNLTQTGEVFGSPIYMSPEQCLGQTLDERSDIYSMGTMFYETLTGLPPLVGNTIVDTMQMHVGTRPAPMESPGISYYPELEALIFKSLEKKPENRFQTMGEMYDALVQVQENLVSGRVSRMSAVPDLQYGQERLGHLKVKESAVALTETPPTKKQYEEAPKTSLSKRIAIDNKSLILIGVILVFLFAFIAFMIFQRW